MFKPSILRDGRKCRITFGKVAAWYNLAGAAVVFAYLIAWLWAVLPSLNGGQAMTRHDAMSLLMAVGGMAILIGLCLLVMNGMKWELTVDDEGIEVRTLFFGTSPFRRSILKRYPRSGISEVGKLIWGEYFDSLAVRFDGKAHRISPALSEKDANLILETAFTGYVLKRDGYL